MKKSPSRLCLCIASLASALSIFAADHRIDLTRVVPVPAGQPVPAMDFFRLPQFSYPVQSPGGGHFAAFTALSDDVTGLLIYDLKTGTQKIARGLKARDIYDFAWLTDNRLIFSLSTEKLYAEGVVAVDLDNLSAGYPIEQHSAVELVSVPRKTPTKPLMWIRHDAYDEGRDYGVVKIDSDQATGKRNRFRPSGGFNATDENVATYGTSANVVRSYDKPPGIAITYLPDMEGEMGFAISMVDNTEVLFRYTGRKWERTTVDLARIGILECGDKPGELIVLGPREDGKPRALQRLDVITGQLGEVLYQDKGYDLTAYSLYRHPVTNHVIGVHFSRNGPFSVWFDPNYHSIQKALDGLFPGKVVRIMGSDREEKQYFVAITSDRQPVTYGLLNIASNTLTEIAATAPWIEPERMQPMSVIKFKTRDGRQLDAYVTMPTGASKANPPPMIVLPHGGPSTRDSWGFNPEVQFLANRGYAVLQPNYRGSPGYNWMFPQGAAWDFRRMHDDVTDATRFLIGSKLIDPSRIAIMGGSFGGYLAICGATYEPDLYRCAISIAGVFDWAKMVEDKKYDQYERAEYSQLKRHLGDPEAERAAFEEISPLRKISQIKIPLFVAHGKDDPVVAVSESRALISELKKFKLPYEAMLTSNEGHGMQKLANQVELYDRIEAFLAKNLLAKPAP